MFDIVPDHLVLDHQELVSSTFGDLYCKLFNRKKKVDLYIRETQEVTTLEKQVNTKRVTETLENWKGNDTDTPSKTEFKWKCHSCPYRIECPM